MQTSGKRLVRESDCLGKVLSGKCLIWESDCPGNAHYPSIQLIYIAKTSSANSGTPRYKFN